MSTPVKEMPPTLEPQEVAQGSRRALLLSLLWPAALLLLAGILSQIELPEEVRGALAGNIRPGYLVAAVLASTLSLPALGMRWRALLPDTVERGLTPSVMTAMVAVAQLLGSTVPGPVGELAAAGLLKRRSGLSLQEILAATVHARALGLLVSALLALSIQLLAPPDVPPAWRVPLSVGVAIATLGSGALFGLVLASDWLQARPEPAFVASLAARPGRIGPLLARGIRLGRSFVQACAGIGRGGAAAHLQAALWAAWAVGLAAAATMGILSGLRVPYSMAGVFFAQGAITVVALAFILLPGLAAGWDAAYVALLVAAGGVPLVPAIAATGLLRVYQTGLMALGAPALAWLLNGADDQA